VTNPLTRSILGASAVAAAALLAVAGCSKPVATPAPRKSAAAPEPEAQLTVNDFADGAYSVDVTKLKDAKWTFSGGDPSYAAEDGGVVLRAELAVKDEPKPAVRFSVMVCPHTIDSQGRTLEFSREFKNWGRSINMADVSPLVNGYYQDWVLVAADVEKDRCKSPTKCAVGPATLWGYATGVDRDSRVRERRDWYVWAVTESPRPCTYVATSIADAKFADEAPKIADLMKAIVPRKRTARAK
jgi:hypothetical protein